MFQLIVPHKNGLEPIENAPRDYFMSWVIWKP